ncbi:uncharacterized protein LOC132639342 [Lycium barbarum]|uniref:uncharacterized protein LOC132639342 n=1 Tax=Lycium barbarum TaxID=112863 RepID=UPI00293F1A5F|nr:uncharacterized protein LOC132639342 [Lycium barbarum]
MTGNLTKRLSQLQQREKFSIKKLYLMMMPQYPRVPWKYMVLQPQLHPKFKFILWRAANKRLAIVDRLMKFGVQVPQTCVFCGLADEMFEHLFFDCPYVKTLWTRMLAWLGQHRLVGTWASELISINTATRRKSGYWAIVNYTFGMLIYLDVKEECSSFMATEELNDMYRSLATKTVMNKLGMKTASSPVTTSVELSWFFY